MKSAEQFYAEGGWNTDANAIKSIKEIQLDAWKQGMTDAAEIVDAARDNDTGLRTVRDRIEIAAKNKPAL